MEDTKENNMSETEQPKSIQDLYAKAMSDLLSSESHRLNPGPYGRTKVEKPEEKSEEETDK